MQCALSECRDDKGGGGVCVGGGQSDAEDGRVEPLVERDHRFALATSFLSASLLFINVSRTV